MNAMLITSLITHLSLYIQASESITKVATVLSSAQVEEHYIPLLRRLSGGDWFTSRTSATSLFSAVYSKVPAPLQEDLRKMYAALGNDDTPMVRRAAARDLGVSFNRKKKIAVCDGYDWIEGSIGYVE